jgi:lysophospholipase L1-like esterase
MSVRGRFLSVLVSVVTALAGFVAVGALPAAAAPGIVQYVALGDSYAAGTAAGSFPDDCEQNTTDGYPARLFDLGSRIGLPANVACSGATASEVAATQLMPLDRDTRLVTLTVGAANLNLSDVLTACTAVPPTRCQAAILQALSMLPALGSDLAELYAEVAEDAPRARIVVTGYPHLFEATAPFDPTIIMAVNQATDELNAIIERSVAAANDADINIHYVDVTEEFAGHGIGADPQEPLFIFPAGTEAFHPTPAGYDAYADAIAAALPGGWFKQSV